MLLLEALNIKKYYSDRLILESEGLRVYAGDKIGIVGQNGSGKTTLMNILAKETEPDEGLVRQYCDLAYIRQLDAEPILADGKALKEFELSGKTEQSTYSGGESSRIKIANAVSSERFLLLADEPTANLDIKGVGLLKQKLTGMESFVLISHDRLLLESLCNRIVEVADGKVSIYECGYSLYREQKEKELRQAGQEYEKYVSEKARLEEAIRDRQQRSRSIRKAPKRMGNSEARLHRRSANEKQEKIHDAANSLKTRLENLEVKEKPREVQVIKLDFSLTDPPENKTVILAEKLGFSYENGKRIFDDAGFRIYNRSKTALWGENGTGKTTLLNLIYGRSNENIYTVPKAAFGYFRQGLENLDPERTVLENVMQDSVQNQAAARTILARLLFAGDDVHKAVRVLSGGERIRVSFARLFVSRANILLLDEPTNYLDTKSIEALENVLREYEGTVMFVSHDSAFVDAVADRLLIFDKYRIVEFEGTLEQYREKGRKLQSPEAGRETERIALQMKIAETVARLSKPGADKEALEEEYRQLILRQRSLSGTNV